VTSMKISDMLRREYIIEDLQARSKPDVLGELSGIFQKGGVSINRENVIRVLMDREKLGSTGIGDGIAIPHGKLPGLDELIVSFGRSKEGIEYDAMDGKRVHIFFLLMAPENSTSQYLKTLAKISRMLKDANFRKRLLTARTKDDILSAVSEKDDGY
jgi:nitrogen PTS system EIIA component